MPTRHLLGRIGIVACICVVAISRAATKGAEVQRTSEPTMAEPAISVSGTVLLSKGTPAADATVYLRASLGGQFYSFGVHHNRDVLARTRTDGAGKFSFEAVGLPPRMLEQIENLRRGEGGAELVVVAKDYAVNWAKLKSFKNDQPLSIKLAPEAPIQGQVRDSAGQPIAGAHVRLYGVTKPAANIDAFLNAPDDFSLNLSEIDIDAKTDEAGKFELHHAPLGKLLVLSCEAPAEEYLTTVVNTSDRRDLARVTMIGGGGKSYDVQAAPLSLTLKPANDVVVTVFDAEGKKVTDGAVQVITEKRTFAGWQPVRSDGTARMNLKDSGKLEFQYGSDPLHPRLDASVTADVLTGGKPATVEIHLPKSTPLAGQVVDAETEAPVAGVYLNYVEGSDINQPPKSRATCVTGSDGKFEVPAAAGPGRLYFGKVVAGYLPPIFENSPNRRSPFMQATEVNVRESADSKPVVLKISRGLVVHGVVRDEAGKPVASANLRAETINLPLIYLNATTDDMGAFTLSGLSPHAKTQLFASSPDGSAEHIIEAQPDFPWDKTRTENIELKLTAGIRLAGRVLRDGKPMPDVRMKLTKLVSAGARMTRNQLIGEATTDADGHYAVNGLAPGDGYMFEIIATGGLVAPDWQHQMPYVQRVPVNAGAELKLPDVNLINADQSLRGIVVDPSGNPVPGITVSAGLGSGMSLSRTRIGTQPWMTTKDDGRFELTDLPDKPIELMAYKGNPKGGPIRNSSKLRPKSSQQDIRIIYDPALGTQPEDLDASSP